jgi:hypothetical protein
MWMEMEKSGKATLKDCKNLLKLIMDEVEAKQKNLPDSEIEKKLEVLRDNLMDSLAELSTEPQGVDEKKKSIKKKLIRLRKKHLAGSWFHLGTES